MFDVYHSDNEDKWRYTLGRAGLPTLFVVGLNPSTATAERSDPTVSRVAKVAKANGYAGFAMLNLYPIRATDYRTLPAKVDKVAFDRNLDAIEALVTEHAAPTLWAAWGESVLHHRFFMRSRDELIRRLQPHRPKWVRFGELTATGHPRHPSRLNYAWSFAPYDTAE